MASGMGRNFQRSEAVAKSKFYMNFTNKILNSTIEYWHCSYSYLGWIWVQQCLKYKFCLCWSIGHNDADPGSQATCNSSYEITVLI